MNIASILTDSRKLTYILGGAIGLMVFVTAIFILRSSIGGGGAVSANIEVWGVFDDVTAFSQSISDFEKANKGIKVNYRLIPSQDYEKTLLNAMAAGTGPDVFMIHNTWLPKFGDKMLPMPGSFPGTNAPLMTLRQYKDLFVDVAYNDFVAGNKIYAMPLYVDTLALYYNKDLFASAGIAQPPVTWTEFQDDIKKLVKRNAAGDLIQSGAAIGTARNINRSTDILMMLMLQSGVQMTDPDNTQATFSRSVDGQPVGNRSLEFYTDFSNPSLGNPVYTWNNDQHYSVDAFAAGETAMMMNYSHQIAAVRQIAPHLNFAIADIPQASIQDHRTFASYWGLAVGLKTASPYAAWQFVDYMTAGAGNIPYLNAGQRPTARRDLVDQQKSDPDLGVFAEQALAARSWYQADNAAIETIFADMIDSVILGQKSVSDALKAAESKVSVIMSK